VHALTLPVDPLEQVRPIISLSRRAHAHQPLAGGIRPNDKGKGKAREGDQPAPLGNGARAAAQQPAPFRPPSVTPLFAPTSKSLGEIKDFKAFKQLAAAIAAEHAAQQQNAQHQQPPTPPQQQQHRRLRDERRPLEHLKPLACALSHGARDQIDDEEPPRAALSHVGGAAGGPGPASTAHHARLDQQGKAERRTGGGGIFSGWVWLPPDSPHAARAGARAKRVEETAHEPLGSTDRGVLGAAHLRRRTGLWERDDDVGGEAAGQGAGLRLAPGSPGGRGDSDGLPPVRRAALPSSLGRPSPSFSHADSHSAALSVQVQPDHGTPVKEVRTGDSLMAEFDVLRAAFNAMDARDAVLDNATTSPSSGRPTPEPPAATGGEPVLFAAVRPPLSLPLFPFNLPSCLPLLVSPLNRADARTCHRLQALVPNADADPDLDGYEAAADVLAEYEASEASPQVADRRALIGKELLGVDAPMADVAPRTGEAGEERAVGGRRLALEPAPLDVDVEPVPLNGPEHEWRAEAVEPEPRNNVEPARHDERERERLESSDADRVDLTPKRRRSRHGLEREREEQAAGGEEGQGPGEEGSWVTDSDDDVVQEHEDEDEDEDEDADEDAEQEQEQEREQEEDGAGREDQAAEPEGLDDEDLGDDGALGEVRFPLSCSALP